MNPIYKSKIVLKGHLWVNIPVILIIIFTWILLKRYTNVGYYLRALIATAIGWIYWEFAILKWIKFALLNQIEKEQILKIGVSNLFLWPNNMGKIEKVASKMKDK
jgi:signal transduction histidine kinase